MTPDEKARELAYCLDLMQNLVDVLRGQSEDLTGRGLEVILRDHLERALTVVIVSREVYRQLLADGLELARLRGSRG